MSASCHEQKQAITPEEMDVRMMSSTKAVAVGGTVARGVGTDERSAQRWDKLSSLASVKVAIQLKLHCLRMVHMAVTDLTAWETMKDFINTGKEEQGFDGSVLYNAGTVLQTSN